MPVTAWLARPGQSDAASAVTGSRQSIRANRLICVHQPPERGAAEDKYSAIPEAGLRQGRGNR